MGAAGNIRRTTARSTPPDKLAPPRTTDFVPTNLAPTNSISFVKQRRRIMVPHFVQYHYNQYHSLILRYWANMTPVQYFGVLMFIAFCGWLLMKSANKR